MGKTVIVYTSKYGSTAKYAKWISENTGADIMSGEKLKVDALAEYDTLVFGGAVHAGAILGIDFLKKNFKNLAGKKIICFAVGLNVLDAEAQKQCREINFVKNLEGMPCFFLPGAYDPAVIKGVDKMIMKLVKKMASGDLLKAIEEGADYTNKDYIKPIVDAIM